jgi:hypothetical protein
MSPRATLTFALPDDERDFRLALSGAAAVQLLYEIEHACRAVVRSATKPHAERLALADEIRSMIRESGVDVDV